MRGVKNNLVGQQFGLLTVVAESLSRNGTTYWRCRCECGRECIKDGHELTRKGKRAWTHSCGCRKALAVHIGRSVGNPGRIADDPSRQHHRAINRARTV